MSQDSAVELTTATITGTDAAELCGMTPDAWRMAQMRQRQGATPALPIPEPIGVDASAPGRPKLYDVSEVVRYRQQLLNSSEVVKRLDEAGVYVRAEVFASTPRVVAEEDDTTADHAYTDPAWSGHHSEDQDASEVGFEVAPVAVLTALGPKTAAFRVLLTVNDVPAAVEVPAEMLVQAFRVSGWLHDTAYRTLRGMFQAYRDHTARRIDDELARRRALPAGLPDPIADLRNQVDMELEQMWEYLDDPEGCDDLGIVAELRELLSESEKRIAEVLAARNGPRPPMPETTASAVGTSANPFATPQP